jgi:hypothetical protein
MPDFQAWKTQSRPLRHATEEVRGIWMLKTLK